MATASHPMTRTVAALPRRERGPVRLRTLVAAALIVLAVVAMALLLQSILSTVLVVLLGVTVAEAIRPFVAMAGRHHIPAPLAVLTVYLVLLGGLAGCAVLLAGPTAGEAATLAKRLPEYQRDVVSSLNGIATHLGVHLDVSQQIGSAIGMAQHALVAVGSTIVAVVSNLVVVLVIAFIWLLSSAGLKRFVADLLPPRHRELAASVINDIGSRAGGYLRGAALNGVIVGAVTGVAAALLGLPDPLLLAVFTAVVALIPVVGAVLGVVVPAVLALTISPAALLIAAAVMTAVQALDANVVVPLVTTRAASVPPLAIIVALLIGGAVAGVLGAVLAVPVAAGIQVLVVRIAVPALHRAHQRATATATEGAAMDR